MFVPANRIYEVAAIGAIASAPAAGVRVIVRVSQTASVSSHRWPVASAKRLILLRLWTPGKNSEVHDQSNETLLEGDEVCGQGLVKLPA